MVRPAAASLHSEQKGGTIVHKSSYKGVLAALAHVNQCPCLLAACSQNLRSTAYSTVHHTPQYSILHSIAYSTVQHTPQYSILHSTAYSTVQHTPQYSILHSTAYSTVQHTPQYSIRHSTAYATVQHTPQYSIRHSTAYSTVQHTPQYSILHSTAYSTVQHTPLGHDGQCVTVTAHAYMTCHCMIWMANSVLTVRTWSVCVVG